MTPTRHLQLAFYGDDFTGSTDALEQLTLAGLRAILFIDVPTRAQLACFGALEAIGVAGLTRSMKPAVAERTLGPAFRKLKALGARHVHYKVCSTFDSSPKIGSIGRAIDVGARVFRKPFVPLLVGAPPLGRYCVFGTLFARYGIGSAGAIHRLDRHPSIRSHPITPMTEADLRRHLGRQTRKRIALLDVLELSRTLPQTRQALKDLLVGKPDVILFDALTRQHLVCVGGLLDNLGSAKHPLFSVGSSGIEMALGAQWRPLGRARCSTRPTTPTRQILVGSGSCSPVTSAQIDWALKHGFAEVPLDAAALASARKAAPEVDRAIQKTARFLRAGRSVVVHTTRGGSDRQVGERLRSRGSRVLGTALGNVLRGALADGGAKRLCIAGGDTSSYAARALGVAALELLATLTPGAPLCRAHAPGSPADGLEVVFKGGQVGGEDYFGLVLKGTR